jgi:ribonuclease III
MCNLPEFRSLELLHRALVHSSYKNEHSEETEDNERLEFLGDAVLGFLVGSLLYDRYPQMNEGELTKLRSALVKEQQLAKFSKKLNIGSKMLLGNGAISNGGPNNTNLLSSTFEAIIGAYYLDSGIEAVKNFVTPLFEEAIANVPINRDFITTLKEWSNKQYREDPKYELIAKLGMDHNPEFTRAVYIKNEKYGQGKGKSKQQADQNAAENALKKLELI